MSFPTLQFKNNKKTTKHNKVIFHSFLNRKYSFISATAVLLALIVGVSLHPSLAQTSSQNYANIIVPSSDLPPVYSPNLLRVRLNSPNGCNIGITNNTPDTQLLLYGVSRGSWKSTGISIAPGGSAGWGVSMPMTSYLSLKSNTRAVLKIVCR